MIRMNVGYILQSVYSLLSMSTTLYQLQTMEGVGLLPILGFIIIGLGFQVGLGHLWFEVEANNNITEFRLSPR